MSLVLGENFLNYNEPLSNFIWYSVCSKTPINWLLPCLSYDVLAISGLLAISITFVSQIAYFLKINQLEKKRTNEHEMVTYNRDGDGNAHISERSSGQSNHLKLWRHSRTVVTPLASFLTFLLVLLDFLLHVYLFLDQKPSGPSVLGQLLLFLSFFELFFLYSLVETIFSPSLRGTFIDVFQSSRNARFIVANV